MTIHLPVRLHHRETNVKCQTFYLVWELVTCVQLDDRHPHYDQNRVSADQSHMTISQAQEQIYRGYVNFFEVFTDQLNKLLIDCKLKFMFFSHMVLP